MPEADEVLTAITDLRGYEIHVTAHYATSNGDALEMGLHGGPDRPDRTLSLRDVCHFELSTQIDGEVRRLDHVEASFLELPDGPWPDALPVAIRRTSRFPILMWVRVRGSVRLDVVAASGGISIDPPFGWGGWPGRSWQSGIAGEPPHDHAGGR